MPDNYILNQRRPYNKFDDPKPIPEEHKAIEQALWEMEFEEYDYDGLEPHAYEWDFAYCSLTKLDFWLLDLLEEIVSPAQPLASWPPGPLSVVELQPLLPMNPPST